MKSSFTSTLFLIGGVALACRPDFDLAGSRVDRPRILAVRATPAEVAPGQPVMLEALSVSPAGPSAVPEWSFCTAPKPLTENNIVSEACLQEDILPIGTGTTAMGLVPPEACTWFGPETPGPGLRPRDPDPTGGYHQPVRVRFADHDTFGLVRISCFLAQAPSRIARTFREGYVPNTHPQLQWPSSPEPVAPGTFVDFEVFWPEASVERYLRFDAASQLLVEETEVLQVSWFATAGHWATDRSTGATKANNTWEAPPTAGPVQLWVVLRDSRGGVDFETHDIEVR